MEKRTVPNCLLIVLIVLFFSGCNSPRSTFAPARSDVIVFAVVYPVETIDNSTLFWQGIELAVKQINQSGGILGRNLQAIKIDDQGSVTEGILIAQSIARERNVDIVIGHWNSRVSIPAAAIYEQAEMMMVTPASTSPELTKENYRFVFQQIADDWDIGREMARIASEQGFKRVAIYYADDAYGRGLANSFEDHANNYGVKLVDRVATIGNDLAVKRLVETWQALLAEAIFIADVLPEATDTIRRLKSAGLDLPILGGTGLDRLTFASSLGSDAEGTLIATLFDPYNDRLEIQSFVEHFLHEYKELPDVWAAQGYDTVKMLADAIHHAGSVKSSQIASSLRQLRDWPGVTGHLSFDSTGKVTGKEITLKKFENGQFLY